MNFEAVSLVEDGLSIRHGRQPKRTLAEQRRLVALWQSSGEKQRAFCRAHDINPKTFSNWIRSAKKKIETETNVDITPTLTCNVELQGVEIILINGVILRFQAGIELQQLLRLLQAVCR